MDTGWYSRGYLPHFDEPGLYQSITFRLHDSMPQSVLDGFREKMENGKITNRQRLSRIEANLDAGHGTCWLRKPDIGSPVENSLLFYDGARYRLIAGCVMPNHVHVLIETRDGFPLSAVLHTWKSFIAQHANRILGRRGPFWQREFFDRRIRGKKHFDGMRAYIEYNPVAAGLVDSSEKWPFGSVRFSNDDDLW